MDWHKNLKKFFPLVILVVFFAVQGYFFYSRTQSFYFEDESEHVTPAWMMITQGSRLYENLSTNHQPLPILTAAVFLKLVSFNTLYLLVERIRQALLVVSFLGALGLVWRFRWRGLVAAILLETVKFYLFGYHLLAESLVVYPLMYMVAVFVEILIEKKSLKPIDGVCMGMSGWWLVFNWLPAVPFVGLLSLMYLKIASPAERLRFLLASLIPTGLLFTVIHPGYWFEETVRNLLLYFLPYEKEFTSSSQYWQFLLYPFRGFGLLPQPIPAHLGGLAVLLLLSTYNRARKQVLAIISLYLVVMTLNLRISRLDIAFYEGFHALPMIAGFTMLAVSLFWQKRLPVRLVILGGLVVVLILGSNLRWWTVKGDKLNEHYIQYSEYDSTARLVRMLAAPTDTLFVGPLHGFITVLSGVPLADRQNAHLDWSWRSPYLRQEFQEKMQSRPPVFVYFPTSQNPYYIYLEPLLLSTYQRVERRDGTQTSLYILTSATNKFSSEQRQRVLDMDFRLPE